MYKTIKSHSLPLIWALVLLHDVLGIGPFLPRVTPARPIHTWGLKLIDILAGSHWWVAVVHLLMANMMLLYAAWPRPKNLQIARWALKGSVTFFTGLSIAFLLLFFESAAYVVTSAFCFSLTIISWRALMDTRPDVLAEDILRAAAWKLTETDKRNGNGN